MTEVEPDFPYDKCPKYDGPGGARGFDPDCCTKPDCPQRDYNRACILTLENLSRAYASMHLLRSAASRLWNCDDEGHTADCPNPECRFGMDMAMSLDRTRRRFAESVVYLCDMLTVPAADITEHWQAFVDTEQARVQIEYLAQASGEGTAVDERLLVSVIKRWITTWQHTAVGEDPVEFHRWFRPPADDDEPPN